MTSLEISEEPRVSRSRRKRVAQSPRLSRSERGAHSACGECRAGDLLAARANEVLDGEGEGGGRGERERPASSASARERSILATRRGEVSVGGGGAVAVRRFATRRRKLSHTLWLFDDSLLAAWSSRRCRDSFDLPRCGAAERWDPHRQGGGNDEELLELRRRRRSRTTSRPRSRTTRRTASGRRSRC